MAMAALGCHLMGPLSPDIPELSLSLSPTRACLSRHRIRELKIGSL